MGKTPCIALLLASLASSGAIGAEGPSPSPLPQAWDYAAAMRKVAGASDGRPGVVLHVGDSITYSNPYGQWARAGEGRTDEDRAALEWMHAGADDETDGWWLARFDHPDGGRSHTAGGLRADELLAGGKQGLPPLKAMLERYRPQAVVLMIGTNDATAGRPLDAYRADVAAAVDLILGRGAVCILSTIPPHPGKPGVSKAYNEALRTLAEKRRVPMIDYEREILTRRPDDWDGTLLGKGDVHPSVGRDGVTPASAPTAENLRESGYLLRGWLSVGKIAEVKRTVFDASPPKRQDKPSRSTPEVKGEVVRLPVTRDNWFSEVGAEADGNNGGSTRLKFKSYQEMSLLDVDPKGLRGRVVLGATLHLRSAGEPSLKRVTVGSFGADWVEGTGTSYDKQPGSSTFRSREHPNVPWTAGGGDLCSVILGNGGTSWRMADASPPDREGWQRIAVDPSIVAARAAGISRGFFAFDDTGSEWTRKGESFTPHPFPNRFVHSRESGAAHAPYLTVTLGPEDSAPPGAPEGLTAGAEGLPPGEAWASWITPTDEGPAGTVGFLATLDGREVPRSLIPLAGKPGTRVRMALRDLGWKPGTRARLEVRAVDGAGNVGEPSTVEVHASDASAGPLPPPGPPAFRGEARLPKLGEAEVAVIDELDKVRPGTDTLIPARPAGYLAANHLWDAGRRQIRLHAARNEFVAFQVVVKGGAKALRPTLHPGDGIEVAFGRYQAVATPSGPLPDPITPLGDGTSEAEAIHVELYVPHDARAGVHDARLTLADGKQTLDLGVSLEVWDFTLPDHLSFLPEMNCYGLPEDEREFYRLAHRHRTVLNRVPYSQGGQVHEGFAPGWDGETLDWKAWDRRFGPYFDGSAFADLPRKGVPLEGFYLPLHENWPTPIEGNYDGSYWADGAFSERHRRAFVAASRQMAAHFDAKGWNDTLFQGFLNGKVDFKVKGWSRGSSPWLLDEPAHLQDFWALRYFAEAFQEGVYRPDGAGGAKLAFRADISRPQWRRDVLDGLLDYHVVGGAMRPYHRLVFDKKREFGEIVAEYGGTGPIEESNVQPAAWCLDAWAFGADGVLPWQTVGTAESWEKADELSLFYPPRAGKDEGPVPSARLKSYRRGQQDVEYLTLWSQLRGEPRRAVGRLVREALRLEAERRGTGFAGGEDAGRLQYGKLRPEDLWALRLRIGRALSDAHPGPRRRLVEFRTPLRDPSKLPRAADFYAGGAPTR